MTLPPQELPVGPPPRRIDALLRARLPRWLLPSAWPRLDGRPVLADVHLHNGRISSVVPHGAAHAAAPSAWDVGGAPVLPGLVEAHVHLDKTFTLDRLGAVPPGLLAAVDATALDRRSWTVEDLHRRATRALSWAEAAGVMHLRTHCDWPEPAEPLAWQVLRELAQAWRGRVAIEQVSLIPLGLFAERELAQLLARRVAGGGPGARLGAFVHSHQHAPGAVEHLLEAAAAHDLDVDLHVDEELEPAAQGLRTVATLARERGFPGRIVCGHACSLAPQDEHTALSTLDNVAAAPITLVSLPITNLLLQDARTGRTPRQRGVTLLKEARARGIPLLISSDNVQDAFCPLGSYDPIEALATGVLAGQLAQPFDDWSDTVCRADRLGRGAARLPLTSGTAADLVVFTGADAQGWPSRAHGRVVVRDGEVRA